MHETGRVISVACTVLRMNHEALVLGLLDLLLSLADRPATAGRLGMRLGVSPLRVAEGLLHLERRGLVDAGKARLTLRGLAIASALRAAREEQRAATAADFRAA